MKTNITEPYDFMVNLSNMLSSVTDQEIDVAEQDLRKDKANDLAGIPICQASSKIKKLYTLRKALNVAIDREMEEMDPVQLMLTGLPERLAISKSTIKMLECFLEYQIKVELENFFGREKAQDNFEGIYLGKSWMIYGLTEEALMKQKIAEVEMYLADLESRK